MPSVPLFPSRRQPPAPAATSPNQHCNPLPSLLQTPSGLAVIEIQGTLHLPSTAAAATAAAEAAVPPPPSSSQTEVGRLVFPLLPAHGTGASGLEPGAWMKEVYLYVGQHQRLTGEVRPLTKPLALVRRRTSEDEDELEIAELVRFKIVFSNRPEPVDRV